MPHNADTYIKKSVSTEVEWQIAACRFCLSYLKSLKIHTDFHT